MSVRIPFVAGRFYEGQPIALKSYIEDVLAKAVQGHAKHGRVPRPSQCILLPHAGHFYCGHVIAETLTLVNLPKTLILLGPNHTGKGKGLSVWFTEQESQFDAQQNTQGWQSPLGTVPIHTTLAKALIASGAGFEADTLAHAQEHSLEVLLPFLQCAVPDVRIVAIAVSGQPHTQAQRAGKALGEIIQKFAAEGEEVGIVISSDMHHFSDHETTKNLDMMALNAFASMNPLTLFQVVKENTISMCGVYPSILALYAYAELGYNSTNSEVVLVKHTTSQEKSGDASRVVGYAGLFVQKRTCKSALQEA